MMRISFLFSKYILIALMLIAADGPCFAFQVDTNLSLSKIVYVSKPDVLYKDAEATSEQYEVLPGQRLLIANEVDNGFQRTALLSDDGSTVQLIGYIKKQTKKQCVHFGQFITYYAGCPGNSPGDRPRSPYFYFRYGRGELP